MIEIKGYSIIDSVKQLRNIIYSRLFFPNCKIIRLPIYIRGKKNIKFGKNFVSGVGNRIETFGKKKSNYKLIFGNGVQINDYCHISAVYNVSVGHNTLIASKVYISDHNHGNFQGQFDFSVPPINWSLEYRPVSIGENCWIGENAIILPGVEIGNNVIIGANTVVTKSIKSFSIAVGNPARVIKVYNHKLQEWERLV